MGAMYWLIRESPATCPDYIHMSDSNKLSLNVYPERKIETVMEFWVYLVFLKQSLKTLNTRNVTSPTVKTRVSDGLVQPKT